MPSLKMFHFLNPFLLIVNVSKDDTINIFTKFNNLDFTKILQKNFCLFADVHEHAIKSGKDQQI